MIIELYYTIAHAVTAMPFGKQALVALLCVFVTSALIYLALWGAKALLYKLAERVGIILEDEREVYEADWMDWDKWEATYATEE